MFVLTAELKSGLLLDLSVYKVEPHNVFRTGIVALPSVKIVRCVRTQRILSIFLRWGELLCLSRRSTGQLQLSTPGRVKGIRRGMEVARRCTYPLRGGSYLI